MFRTGVVCAWSLEYRTRFMRILVFISIIATCYAEFHRCYYCCNCYYIHSARCTNAALKNGTWGRRHASSLLGVTSAKGLRATISLTHLVLSYWLRHLYSSSFTLSSGQLWASSAAVYYGSDSVPDVVRWRMARHTLRIITDRWQ